MSRIRGRNTKPEVALRSALHAAGLRFRLHRKDLPGSPDIVFPSARLAVFVDGCFWHGCPVHSIEPKTNTAFWLKKLEGNRARDTAVNTALQSQGWTVLRFWEHDVKKDLPTTLDHIKVAVLQARSVTADRHGDSPDYEHVQINRMQ